jgi:RND family efflux transporter MFP subunit
MHPSAIVVSAACVCIRRPPALILETVGWGVEEMRQLAFIVALALAACDQAPSQPAAPPPPAVTVAKPVVKQIVEYDEFTGRFDAIESVEIRARVNGYLESVHFRDGEIVQRDDLLFVIDPRPYKAVLDQAEAAVRSIATRLEFAKVELDRAERLFKTGAGTERSVDERRQAMLQAQADIAGAQAAVDRARLDLGYTEIRAPIAGRISRKLVSEGNLVMADQTLLTTLVAVDPIYFYFDVDERTYLSYRRLAQNGSMPSPRVQIQLADEKDWPRAGAIDFIDNRVDASTGTMRLRAAVPNPELLIAPGMFGRVSTPGSGQYQAVLIPDEAVFADQDRRLVYVVDAEGKVEPRAVRLGSRQDGYRIIRSGLRGDETVVINGLQRVRLGGGRVTPQMTELPPSR